MALDLDVDVLVALAQVGGEIVEHDARLVAELGAVEAEAHPVVAQHGLVEELALGQLAGRHRPLERLARGLRQAVELGLLLGQPGLVGLHLALDGVDLLGGARLRRLDLLADEALAGAAGDHQGDQDEHDQGCLSHRRLLPGSDSATVAGGGPW